MTNETKTKKMIEKKKMCKQEEKTSHAVALGPDSHTCDVLELTYPIFNVRHK